MSKVSLTRCLPWNLCSACQTTKWPLPSSLPQNLPSLISLTSSGLLGVMSSWTRALGATLTPLVSNSLTSESSNQRGWSSGLSIRAVEPTTVNSVAVTQASGMRTAKPNQYTASPPRTSATAPCERRLERKASLLWKPARPSAPAPSQ